MDKFNPKQERQRKLNAYSRQTKTDSKKIIDRLTYNPGKHKQKQTRALRQKLQQKTTPPPKTTTPPQVIKFGSFNVNGLDLEAAWAVEQLLKQRGFDVSDKSQKNKTLKLNFMQILALSETHGRADKPSILEPIEGFNTWNTERSGSDKGGGGLTILYNEALVAHQWTPDVPKHLQYVNTERQWLLLNTSNGGKCAFLHCYIACQNYSSEHFIQWNEDLFFMMTQEAIKLRRQGFMILAMGDFNSRIGQVTGLEGNTPDTNRNQPMFMSFITEVNLFIVNSLPISQGLFTRFMGNSSLPGTKSLLDYALVDTDHMNNVSSIIIDEQAHYECGSDHALLECDVVLGPSPHIKWNVHDVLQYNFSAQTDFTKYQSTLEQSLSSISITKFSEMETNEMLPHITTSINNSAKHTFGLKVKKKKKGMSLPKSILTKIKAKNQLARTLHIALLHQDPQADQLEHDHEQLKLQIRDNISDLKLQKRRNLRSKLLRGDPTRKRFWRFLKSQAKSAGSITALYKVITITLKHCITPKLSTLQDQNLRHTLYHFGLISRKNIIIAF